MVTTGCDSTDNDASSVICRLIVGRVVVRTTGKRKPGCSVTSVTQIAPLPSKPALVGGRCVGLRRSSSILFWFISPGLDLFPFDFFFTFCLTRVFCRTTDSEGVLGVERVLTGTGVVWFAWARSLGGELCVG